MFWSIEDIRAYRPAKKIVSLTGKPMTEVVDEALREKLAQVERMKSHTGLAEELNRLALYCASLPRHDNRNPDEIIDYDEYGLPR